MPNIFGDCFLVGTLEVLFFVYVAGVYIGVHAVVQFFEIFFSLYHKRRYRWYLESYSNTLSVIGIALLPLVAHYFIKFFWSYGAACDFANSGFGILFFKISFLFTLGIGIFLPIFLQLDKRHGKIVTIQFLILLAPLLLFLLVNYKGL